MKHDNSMKYLRFYIGFLAIFMAFQSQAVDVSFTVDDPNLNQSPLLSPYDRNEKILDAFDRYKVKGALFVCGKKVDSLEGKVLLQAWDDRGHDIANHTYTHSSYSDLDFEIFRDDLLQVEPLIQNLKNYTKLFRFPYLKEGETFGKRDSMRKFLKENNYGNGYVTIDASDWYVEERMVERLKKNPKAYLEPYRDFYLQHMWDRATYYNDLAKKVFGRQIKHTILIHHNLLNALFLQDLMRMFEKKGWNIVSSHEAFRDPVFKLEPNILPAGESIVWSVAKETGQYKHILRYPAEDGEYEKAEMDKLGL